VRRPIVASSRIRIKNEPKSRAEFALQAEELFHTMEQQKDRARKMIKTVHDMRDRALRMRESPRILLGSPIDSRPSLTSWKEIATYLGKGVRTVQRYEAEFALPVRRPAGKNRTSVVALRSELEAWVKRTSKSNPPSLQLIPINSSAPLRKNLAVHTKNCKQMVALRGELLTAHDSFAANVRALFVLLKPQQRGE
jgi:hypothetical protein